ncbi:hypothetical protein HYU94_03865 [Candidatus Daviesbacteria bacterium]|nr:hypothetical protein [Candidatus Daviesbacteria bacterium]
MQEILRENLNVHHVIDSSFEATTPEVETAREALKTGDSCLVPYEFAQNSVDYNNYRLGLPTIICEMRDGRRIFHYELVNEKEDPRKIEFHNFIKPGFGMDPYQISSIKHEAEGATLGKHGRGGTVAATAALVDHHITRIDYVSIDKRRKPYKARGTMKNLHPDRQSDSRFVLEIEDLSKPVDETIVSLSLDPSKHQLADSLKLLPRYFIPANPFYEHARFAGRGKVQILNNLFTVYATGLAIDERSTFFSKEELESIGFTIKPVQLGGEIPRIEIIPDELIGRNPEEKLTEHAYEGGLRLESLDKCVLNWSFYGFDQRSLRYKYSVSRSHDSSYINGYLDNLIGMALRNCNKPEIFKKLLAASVSEDEEFTEAKIDSKFLMNLPVQTKTAFEIAWKELTAELGLGTDILITNDKHMKEKVEEANKKVLFINSKAVVDALSNNLGIGKAEDVLGVTKAAEPTGELIRCTRYDRERHLKLAVDSAVEAMWIGNGVIREKELYTVIKRKGFDEYNEFSDLPESVQRFVKNYLLLGGKCDVRAGGNIFEFELSSSSEYEAKIKFKKGKLDAPKSGIEIRLTADDGKSTRVFKQLTSGIAEEIKEFEKEDNAIDWVKYARAKRSEEEALEIAIAKEREIFVKKEEEKTKNSVAQERRKREILNKIRSKITLPSAVRTLAAAGIAGGLLWGGNVVGEKLAETGIIRPFISPEISIGGLTLRLPNLDFGVKKIGGIRVPWFENRLPDKITSGELEILEPVAMAKVLKIPTENRMRAFPWKTGDRVGYFPLEELMNTNDAALGRRLDLMQSFENAEIKDSLEGVAIVAGPDELVYKQQYLYQSLYPPVGWKITRIYQKGGKEPLTNKIGALYWKDERDIPKDLIVVVKSIDEYNENVGEGTSSQVSTLGKSSPFGEYTPRFDATKAMELNEKLKDPFLKQLHKDFAEEMQAWQTGEKRDKKEATKIIMKYLNKFAYYSDYSREYGLGFQINKKGTGYDTLISIADKKDEGYFCSVASNAASEFLKSVGVYASNQPGNNLYLVDDLLYSNVSHQNNLIYAPDGTLIYADFTPWLIRNDDYASKKLAASGMNVAERVREAKNRKDIPYIGSIVEGGHQLLKQIQTWDALRNTAEKAGIPLGTLAISFFALKKLLPHLKQREVRKRIERSVSVGQVAPVEQALIASIVYRLANDEDADVDTQLKLLSKFSLKEHGPGLEWLTADQKGIPCLMDENGLLDQREVFARLAWEYVRNNRDVQDRFMPSLRYDFVKLGEEFKSEGDNPDNDPENFRRYRMKEIYVPSDFQYLYDMAVLIKTGQKRTSEGNNPHPEIIKNAIENLVSRGLVFDSKLYLLNALYIQITGRQLPSTIAKS